MIYNPTTRRSLKEYNSKYIKKYIRSPWVRKETNFFLTANPDGVKIGVISLWH